MMRVETEEEQIVAILHDVVEDTDWTFDALRNEGFSETVIEALETVTKQSEDEDYEDFIKRSLRNDIGRKVKIADLLENLDVTRIGELSEKDSKRINKYKKALQTLKTWHRFDTVTQSDKVVLGHNFGHIYVIVVIHASLSNETASEW